MMNNPDLGFDGTHQTVSVNIGTLRGRESIRIGFTDQRLTAHGGMALWSAFLQKVGFRGRLAGMLPQEPSSPNAYEPVDIALGFMGGVVSGADKLSRVAYLAGDAAMAEVLGIEAVPSQSTLSRFFQGFSQEANEGFGQLHAWAAGRLASRVGGYTLDMDSWALLHEDGHQEGVAVGYTRLGLKPCHRPLIAALAEARMVCGFWLRRGDSGCGNNAGPFLRATLGSLPRHIRVGLVRADSGFCQEPFLEEVEAHRLRYIVAARLSRKLQSLCRHDDAAWTPSGVPGLEIQEVAAARPGRRLIVMRHRIAERPEAGGRPLLVMPGYKFQALLTNLPDHWTATEVWRRYNGRADIENRIKELGAQFGVRALCCHNFWATEAACQLAVVAYN